MRRILIGVALMLSMTFQAVKAAEAGALMNAEAEARQSLELFIAAWNSADIDRIRQELNYPHITHTPLGLRVATTAADFVTNFEDLRAQGWASSSFNTITTTQVSAEKVNFEVEYTRWTGAGEVLSTGYIYYVLTKVDGHWGMQYRTPSALADAQRSSQLVQAHADVTEFVEEFFRAFNAADNLALRPLNQVPQIMLNAGNFIEASDESHSIVRMNFAAMREREDWGRSAFKDFRIVSAMANKVIVELSFERFHPDGGHYRTVPAVWVVARRDNRWGIEFRSLMPAL